LEWIDGWLDEWIDGLADWRIRALIHKSNHPTIQQSAVRLRLKFEI
jgi:hypothetical protein